MFLFCFKVVHVCSGTSVYCTCVGGKDGGVGWKSDGGRRLSKIKEEKKFGVCPCKLSTSTPAT